MKKGGEAGRAANRGLEGEEGDDGFSAIGTRSARVRTMLKREAC